MTAERTVLITGASSGIGRCFAEAYARQNCRLILCGQNTDALEELSRQLNTECTVIPGNLSEEDQCLQLLKQLEDTRIDIFINNAGFGAAGRFTEIPLEKELEMVRVNDLAQHILFKGILQKMQQQDSGTILNVASSAGLFPGGPYMAAYYASKAYMASLTRSVAQELKETGSTVYVCALCPGPVDTQFNNRADVIFSLKGITPEKCVSECLKAMGKHKTIIVPTLKMKAAVILQRLVPTSLMVRMTGHQQKKKINAK